ncbi:MAG TPA: ankyrin repeat domain-containing protein [Methylocella sp.]|nr:ankyrin repeat domain-containing protein [Methylocella sp.]
MRSRMPFQRIDVSGTRCLIESGGTLVLDVRDAGSFERWHIEGARNVSIGNLDSIIQRTSRSKPILIYCYHGYASQEYAQIFSDFGFSCVYSLDGGYKAWTRGKRTGKRLSPGAALEQWLLAHNFPPGDANAAGANSMTPLMKASHEGDASVVRMLLDAGTQVNARNADGNNALWLACVGGHLDIMDMLIGAGVDINNRNENGATCLMYAASTGKAAVLQRLLTARADVTPETLDGFTALDMAATLDCLTLLRKAARDLAVNQSAAPV